MKVAAVALPKDVPLWNNTLHSDGSTQK